MWRVAWRWEGSTNNMMLWHNIILLVVLVGWCVACGVEHHFYIIFHTEKNLGVPLPVVFISQAIKRTSRSVIIGRHPSAHTHTEAMVKTAEDKVRKRYAEQLKQGIEPKPLNDANRAILAEVREEVRSGCNTIKYASYNATKSVENQANENEALHKVAAQIEQGGGTDPENCDQHAELRAELDQLDLENRRLANYNKVLEKQLEDYRRNAMANPEIQEICSSMSGLQLENEQLRQSLSLQIEQNEWHAANHSQSSVDARPVKSRKGFGVGDVVYVASEFWHMKGKHPKGYDSRSAFIIVKQAYWEGFWDLCAKKDMRKQPKKIDTHIHGAAPLGKPFQACFQRQLEIQSLYDDGHLADVPVRFLNSHAWQADRKAEPAVYIDLRTPT